MEDLILKVQEWAVDKGIDNPENWPKQLVKFFEESGELASSLLKGKREEELDSFGDVQVVLIILALQRGVDLKAELEKAYDIISKRTGTTVGGVFVKS